MNFSILTIDEILLKAKLAISNTLFDPLMMQALSIYGYDETKLNQGLSICTEAESLVQIRSKEYGEQYQAMDDFHGSKLIADKTYIKSLKIARIAFNDNTEALKSLNLLGSRKRTFSGWLTQAKTFYANMLANDEYVSKMQNYGYTAEKLQAEQALVIAAEENNFSYDKEKGEAQQSTVNRDKKIDDLIDWFRSFLEIAKIALEENPQWLEKLGIVVKSE